jgi:transcriptional regulator
MRHNPHHAVTDPAIVRRLIRENPWATFVSDNDGLVASHYPILLDEESEELAIYSHVGRPDEEIHGLGTREILVIVAGPHGYISPTISEDKDPVSQRQVIEQLRGEGPYAHPVLADEMERALARR